MQIWRSDYSGEVASGLTVLVAVYVWGVIYRRFPGFFSRLLGINIKITSPVSSQGVTGKKQYEEVSTYDVRGKLRKVPKDHEIWLLVRDQSSHNVWPQGWEKVEYNEIEKTWAGKVSAKNSDKRIEIIAVVAPPTSSDLFAYFCRHGKETNWAPLLRLPPECTNIHSVQARLT
jgi:hypothetical protein